MRERVNNLVSLLTLEEKVVFFSGHFAYGGYLRQGYLRLGIQESRQAAECLHGVAWGGTATAFPSSLGLSQTWNKDLLCRIGRAIGYEMYAKGRVYAVVLVVDLLRDPRYGQAYETMGEDAVLTGELGNCMAMGLNSRAENGYQLCLPMLKHFMAYNNEIHRIWTNSVLAKRNIHEYYFKVFKKSIASGAAKSIMASYPLVNGKPMMVNPLIDFILKEWVPDYPDSGKDEFAVDTDYRNPTNLVRHNQRFYYDNPEGRALSAADSIKNHILGFSEFTKMTPPAIYDALAKGMLTEADLDKNVRRGLTLRMRVGDFDLFDSWRRFNQ